MNARRAVGVVGSACLWGSLVVGCTKVAPPAPVVVADAAASAPAVVASATATATATVSVGRVDAAASAAPVEIAIIDAGPPSCRLVLGPIQQPVTGPAAIAVTDVAVDVVTNQGGGAARVTSFPVDALANAKPVMKALDGGADRAFSPPCAIAGASVFCADARGDVHRSTRVAGGAATTGDTVVAHAYPGARVAAAKIGVHVVLGFLAKRATTEGWTSEAFAKVDDAEAIGITEAGSGATEIDLIERGAGVVALLVDARRAMTPLHARVLRYTDRLLVGADEVVSVAGGANAQVHGALATSLRGDVFALLPDSLEAGFGLLTVRIDDPPRMEEPSTASLYPNGIDAAPVAATHGGHHVYVARVRPMVADPRSQRVLELGRIDAGAFTSLGLVSTAGSVREVDVEIDRLGALWLHYTDAAGSWVERRVCGSAP